VDGGEAKHARLRSSRLQSWQVVLAAGITAFASIVAAHLTTGKAAIAVQVPKTIVQLPAVPAKLPPQDYDGSSIGITSITLNQRSSTSRARAVFRGVLYGWSRLPQADAEIFILAEPPNLASIDDGQSYRFTSPAADISEDGSWVVRWTLPAPPFHVRWVAILAIFPNPVHNGKPDGTSGPPWRLASKPFVPSTHVACVAVRLAFGLCHPSDRRQFEAGKTTRKGGRKP
jgi:hypothetical protein